MKIISHNIENLLWNKLYNEYKFTPGIPWTNEQEYLINSFLEELIHDEMYALDWQHECFIFSPKEHIPCDYEYYDSIRNCNVYFPTYYPNGDYHIFIDSDWKYGMFGNPWKNEIIIMGKKLKMVLMNLIWNRK